MSNKLHDIVYLAAWLRNIGKFRERAGIPLSGTALKLKEDFCPASKNDGNYLNVYGLHSYDFILEYENIFTSALGKLTELTEEKDSFFKLASSHNLNNESSDLEKIIRNAENLSTGMEADEATDTKNQQESPARMNSVFEGLSNGEHKHKLPLISLDSKENIFPAISHEEGKNEYSVLWNNFIKEFESRFEEPDLNSLLTTLPYLIEKYCSFIPSATNKLSDVSLYDHSKTTAAFASCLFNHSGKEQIENEFLLIGGDLSGIQKFLYDISGKSAAKNLKGRSFYLQLLVDSVVKRLLNQLGLLDANIIYSSGGGFYILAPCSTRAKTVVKELENETTSYLYKNFGTSLFMAIEYSGFSSNLVRKNGIPDVWTELAERLAMRKRKKFESLIYTDYSAFFEPEKIDEKQVKDAITGEEIKPGEKTRTYNDNKIKVSTWEQIELGKDLKGADYLITAIKPLDGAGQAYQTGDSEYYYHLVGSKETNENIFKKGKEFIINIQFLKPGTKPEILQDLPLSQNYSGGTDYPVYGSDIKSNGEIHYKDEPRTYDEFTGNGRFKRLGYLRMDVDHLGLVFKKGLDREKSTFSRYSTLSRQLDFFFKAWIDKISQKEEYKNDTVIVYSGGDDLFLVSRWDKAIKLAEEIRNDFKSYTCGILSISGGVAITTGKYPILRAAEESGEEESLAKEHTINKMYDRNNSGQENHSSRKTVEINRNSFSFFNHPLNWDEEYPTVKKLQNELTGLINQMHDGAFPNSLFERIYKYYETSGVKKHHRILNLKVIWMLAYDIKRIKEMYRNHKAFGRFLDQVQNDIITNQVFGKKYNTVYHSLEIYMIAFRWTELVLRTNEKK